MRCLWMHKWRKRENNLGCLLYKSRKKDNLDSDRNFAWIKLMAKSNETIFKEFQKKDWFEGK